MFIQTLPYLRTFKLRTTVHTNMSARMSDAISDGNTDILAAERGLLRSPTQHPLFSTQLVAVHKCMNVSPVCRELFYCAVRIVKEFAVLYWTRSRLITKEKRVHVVSFSFLLANEISLAEERTANYTFIYNNFNRSS